MIANNPTPIISVPGEMTSANIQGNGIGMIPQRYGSVVAVVATDMLEDASMTSLAIWAISMACRETGILPPLMKITTKFINAPISTGNIQRLTRLRMAPRSSMEYDASVMTIEYCWMT